MMCPSKKIKKICVFCGSSSGKKGVFSNEALNLGVNWKLMLFDIVSARRFGAF
jgi:hypothetical protein